MEPKGWGDVFFHKKAARFSWKSTDFGFRTKFNSPFDGLGSVIALFFGGLDGPKVEKELLFFLELESTEASMLL